MAGIKNYTKGFYKDLILIWVEHNKNNKFMSMSEIIKLFKREYDKNIIQAKLYKTLIFMKEKNLVSYENLKWNLNLKNIESLFNNKIIELNKIKFEYETKIKIELEDLIYLKKKLNNSEEKITT